MSDAPAPAFTFGDDPDLPGWSRWTISDPTRFNSIFGPLSVKLDGEIARVRFSPEHDLTTQFIAGAPLGDGHIEARVELLRETGRLLFMRGLIVQGESADAPIIVSFTGTIRKPSPK
jgi:hypothetical protein